MTNIVALNSQEHRALRVKIGASALYGDDKRFVSVVLSEFPLLAAHYPIFLSKDSETGIFYCGAMLGFDEGENLFLTNSGVTDAYRPLNLQRAPFYAAGSELAIDLDNPRVNTTDGQALFSDDGEPTPYLEAIMATFRELRPGAEKTKAFIDVLISRKLVEPIQINVGFDDGVVRNIQGLYTASQDALRELSDADALDLFRRGYLYLIHLMIASLKQVPVLAQRKNRLLAQDSGVATGSPG